MLVGRGPGEVQATGPSVRKGADLEQEEDHLSCHNRRDEGEDGCRCRTPVD